MTTRYVALCACALFGTSQCKTRRLMHFRCKSAVLNIKRPKMLERSTA